MSNAAEQKPTHIELFESGVEIAKACFSLIYCEVFHSAARFCFHCGENEFAT